MEAGQPFSVARLGDTWQIESDHGIISTAFEGRAKQVAGINVGDAASLMAGLEGLSFCTFGDPAVDALRRSCLDKLSKLISDR